MRGRGEGDPSWGQYLTLAELARIGRNTQLPLPPWRIFFLYKFSPLHFGCRGPHQAHYVFRSSCEVPNILGHCVGVFRGTEYIPPACAALAPNLSNSREVVHREILGIPGLVCRAGTSISRVLLCELALQVLTPSSGSLDYAISMRPEYHQAIIDVVKFYGWKHIIYMYDSHDGEWPLRSKKPPSLVLGPIDLVHAKPTPRSTQICRGFSSLGRTI